MIKIAPKRRIIKTASWRIIAAFITFVTVALFSNFFAALALAGVASLSDLIIKTAAYWVHERAWDKSIYMGWN